MTHLKKTFFVVFICMAVVRLTAQTSHRRWTVADGLPTEEVQQMVSLPNGQVLVNCEGIFCLSNGKGFTVLPCDRLRCLPLEHHLEDYAHWWQGDSLLWLHDFYHACLFDARTRSFRYDFEVRTGDEEVKRFLHGDTQNERLTPLWRNKLDSLRLGTRFTTAIEDWQGGIWLGTIHEGIIYRAPIRPIAQNIDDHILIDLVRSTTDNQGNVWHCKSDGLYQEGTNGLFHYDTNNVEGLPHNRTTFIQELADGRYLLCDSLCLLGYFYKDKPRYVLLNDRLPQLNGYRRLVGACPLDDEWVLVYSQNGAFLLDTKTDTFAFLDATKEIERFSNKYNCAVSDAKGLLWIGTQNGLFCLTPTGKKTAVSTGLPKYTCEHIDGLANNCIRSLVVDTGGHVWAGTARGISRVTPTVINLNGDDGIPEAALMERAAQCMTDGSIVFAYGPDKAVMFRQEWFDEEDTPLPVVVMTAMSVNGETLPLDQLSADFSLPYYRNYLAFQFSALNYATPSHTRYRYRLTGLEQKWQYYSTETGGSMGIVDYHALPSGDYVFEVQGSLDGIRWGKSTRTGICILPPLWLTWWAKLIYCLLAIFCILCILNFYLKRKRKKLERENDQRVNQLFELREEARHQFAESTNIDPQKIGINSEEEELTARMLKAIEAHLSDADYGVDQLAQDVFMSRSAFYTKLRNMLGISPADFIRNVRLKCAARLLSDTELPIGEIADRVGYNTHKAFATNFKKMFGVLPSEYRDSRNHFSSKDIHS